MEDFNFVPRGSGIPALDQDRIWEFKPLNSVKVGSMISGGDIYGSVFENNLFDDHKVLIDPRAQGRVTYIAPEGNYTLKDKLLEVEHDGKKIQYGMSHFWPIREPRPILGRLQSNTPLLTGIRVLDALFPSVPGGSCCLPRTIAFDYDSISYALAKSSSLDGMIYVGCGERAKDMA